MDNDSQRRLPRGDPGYGGHGDWARAAGARPRVGAQRRLRRRQQCGDPARDVGRARARFRLHPEFRCLSGEAGRHQDPDDASDAHPEAGFAGSYITAKTACRMSRPSAFPAMCRNWRARRAPARSRACSRGAGRADRRPKTTRRVDWVAGASLMMRRRVLDAIGLFDETFFFITRKPTCACARARAGHLHYVPAKAEVTHIGSVSTGMKTGRRTPVLLVRQPMALLHQESTAAPMPRWRRRCTRWAGRRWRVRRVLGNARIPIPRISCAICWLHSTSGRCSPPPGKRPLEATRWRASRSRQKWT